MSYLDIAIKAAFKAGSVHKKYFGKAFKVQTKTTSFDLVTTADTEAEDVVVRLIRKKYPAHNILAEEKIYQKTNSEYTWIIDPLDGTNNFASGLPIFCASVGLAYRNKVIAGAIYDVSRNELFYARRNKGAFLNGKRIHINKAANLGQAIIITGFYYSRDKDMIDTLDTMKRFLRKRIIGIRRLGSAALDLCYVASGRAAGFWEFTLSPWDFAAGSLIIQEAGGKVTDNCGNNVLPVKKTFIVASNTKIHSVMLEVINEK
ncbi:MAG: inositol monophosphatase family protein [Candidatus Omnitrophota bacterium]